MNTNPPFTFEPESIQDALNQGQRELGRYNLRYDVLIDDSSADTNYYIDNAHIEQVQSWSAPAPTTYHVTYDEPMPLQEDRIRSRRTLEVPKKVESEFSKDVEWVSGG